ncbi:site-specific DNA-methyltransferase [uncultured Pseudokineococcus sp.]|uniref:site-specific DNA-methyltransferase n=1 Tax=uncultured Pseudokineococcus sp. TaxID=1642928 RepID=UPI0026376A32|nr:site-specific DNA-methyltransferase [uncultured Pseudokineococcus sp.]
MTDEISEVPSATPNFHNELAAQLADLIPEAIADGKVDVEKLKELLDGDAVDGSERFGLFWPGKKRALRAAQEPTTATLKPDFDNSKDWDKTQNVFIEGDNLEVLKVLQKHYHAKIQLIYIDPPYNTGKDFVYPDNYKEGLDTYLEWTHQVNEEGTRVTTNAETEGRYHSNWLNMMYPRLKLARNLLTDDGIIFISIDDNELGNLLKLANEIFGEANFIATFKWNKTSKAPSLSKLIRNKYEYVVCYRKKSASILRGVDSYNVAAPLFNSGNSARVVQFPAASIQFKFSDRSYQVGTFGKPGKEVELLDSLTVRSGTNVAPVRIRARFSWSESTVLERLEAGTEVFFKTPSLATMYYGMGDRVDAFIAPSDIINDDEVGVKRNTEAFESLRELFDGVVVFDYSKPTSLLRYLSRMIPSDSFIALDFFAGSGTLGHALMELNAEDGGRRRCIQVQLPEPTGRDSAARAVGLLSISQVAQERLRRAGKRVQEAITLDVDVPDVGFRSYRLSDTNFSKWRSSSNVEEDALQQHLLSLRDSAADDATADELLTEILLKQGYSLTEAISSAEISGLDVRIVRDSDGDVAVLAYLNEHAKPTLEQLRELVDESPTRIIVLEDAFQGDDEIKTNLAQLAKSKGIEIWTA